MDVFVSASGGVHAGICAGIPSVRMSIITYIPEGLQLDNSVTNMILCPNGITVFEYLKWVLIYNVFEVEKADYRNDWNFVCSCLDEHMEFVGKSAKEFDYYDLEKLKISRKKMYKRFFRTVLGLSLYNWLHDRWAAYLNRNWKDFMCIKDVK